MTFYDWENHEERSITHGYSRGVAVGSNLMMAHVKLETGAITTPHSHEHEEIIYVVAGRWQVTVGGREFIVEADQSLVVPPHVEHSSIALEETLAVVATNYRPEWSENSDFWLHYNTDNHLWAV
ncbi:MAG: cupin domain-containing protein [Acidobacteria bacterium]|nr:cupin domain-containing protein [Acidobacteriota bacterium]